MPNLIYNSFKEFMADGTIDLDGDTFNAMLLDASHTENAAHSLLADVSGDEIAGTGYTAGGAVLASVTWNRSGAVVTFDAAGPAWPAATFSAGFLVVYDDTPAGDPLVCIFDFGGEESVVNGTFTFQFNAAGMITLT